MNLKRAKRPKVKRQDERYRDGVKKLFIGAIPCKARMHEFRAYFGQYGPIEDICLPLKDYQKKINRGHGFVTYKHSYSAKLVMEQYKKHFIREKWVQVKIAKPRNAQSPNYKAFQSETTDFPIKTSKQSIITEKEKIVEDDSSLSGSDHSGYINFLLSANLSKTRKSLSKRRESFSKHQVFSKSEKMKIEERVICEADKRFSQQVNLTEEQKKVFENVKKRFSLVDEGHKCHFHKRCFCFKKQ